jgi:hypothetical protein
MSAQITYFGDGLKWGKNGYYWSSGGIITKSGSTYRLEVEVEGYPSVVATSTMPEQPVVYASMDTSTQVTKKNIKEVVVAGYMLNHLGNNWNENYPVRYWQLVVNTEISTVNNYAALDVVNIEYSDNVMRRTTIWGIGGSDVSILLENGMNRELLNNDNTDLYLFHTLIATGFEDASRNLYVAIDSSTLNPLYIAPIFADSPDVEKATIQHQLMLRFRNITPETYRYFHSLTTQYYSNNKYNEQPATVVGNIEGGFGIFSVYSATYIPLLEWETVEYRK